MSAIALILIKKGFSISGSDTSKNVAVMELIKNGAKFFETQTAQNIQQIHDQYKQTIIVVISSAIPENNVELLEAQKRKIKIFHRSDVLAWLTQNQTSILVGGSHGKTTTSTLITTLLALNDQDPTAIIGGTVPLYQSNAHAGKGRLLIAEADESDGTLVKFKGDISVITNIELDHTNFYPNIEALQATIKKFGENSKKTIVNFDCINLKRIFDSNAIWWSIRTMNNIDFAAIPKSMNGDGTIADFYEQENYIGEINVPLTGLHNLSNMVGAIAACRLAGLSFVDLKNSLKRIQSPGRRFEFKGQWKGRQIMDDYAHHPSEIEATISAAKIIINSKKNNSLSKSQRLVIVFQPHRYSRTKDLLQEFALCFKNVDILFLAPIYGAGEKKINGVNIESMSNLIKSKFPNLPTFISKDFQDLETLLNKKTIENDLIIFMGAGNINEISNNLIEKSKGKRSNNIAA